MLSTKQTIEIISNKFINVKNYEIITSGQYNVIIVVNDKWVFRIPKFLKEIDVLRKQVKQLDFLYDKLTLPIPKFSYLNLETDVIGHAMVGYRIIKGEPLLQEKFYKIADQNFISKQLAFFLKSLHDIKTEDTKGLSVPIVDNYKFWFEMYRDIDNLLFKYMRSDAIIKIKRDFDEYLSDPENQNFKPKLIHNDFGPTNILSDGNEITGIIDFDSLSFNDPAVDIASLIGKFGYGQDFVISMGKYYQDIDKLLERAKFYRSTFALQDAIFGVKNNDIKAFNSGMIDYV